MLSNSRYRCSHLHILVNFLFFLFLENETRMKIWFHLIRTMLTSGHYHAAKLQCKWNHFMFSIDLPYRYLKGVITESHKQQTCHLQVQLTHKLPHLNYCVCVFVKHTIQQNNSKIHFTINVASLEQIFWSSLANTCTRFTNLPYMVLPVYSVN